MSDFARLAQCLFAERLLDFSQFRIRFRHLPFKGLDVVGLLDDLLAKCLHVSGRLISATRHSPVSQGKRPDEVNTRS